MNHSSFNPDTVNELLQKCLKERWPNYETAYGAMLLEKGVPQCLIQQFKFSPALMPLAQLLEIITTIDPKITPQLLLTMTLDKIKNAAAPPDITSWSFQLLKLLQTANLITAIQVEEAKIRIQLGTDISLFFVLQKIVKESSLLRTLAKHYQTQYIVGEKLAVEINHIPMELKEQIPLDIAEKLQIMPIYLSAASTSISIVMADPHDSVAIAEIQLLCKTYKIHTLVALPALIKAGIKKLYQNDSSEIDHFMNS